MGFTTILMVCVILPVLVAQQTPTERHSLYYVYTALSKAVNAPGIFEFTAMGLLDDRKIDYYDSVNKAKIPQQEWMKEKLPADYWEKGTQSRKSKEQWFKVNVNILMERMRQNGSDIHVLMWKHGCEIDKMPDGSFKFARGVDAYSYDGIDFLSFDDASMQWVAPVNEAVPTKQKWDGVPILNQYTKGYLEKECVDWLEKFRDYGGKELQQQMTASPPEVTLFAKPMVKCADKLTLTCMATGFHPKDIYITILKGEDVVLKGDASQVMPNGDGTHQIKLSVEAKGTELDAYRCEMNHIALTEKISITWPLDGIFCGTGNQVPTGVVVGVVVAVVVLMLTLGLLLIALKKGIIEIKNGFKFNGFGKDPVPPVENQKVCPEVNKEDSDSGKGSTNNGSSNALSTGSTKGSLQSMEIDINIDAAAEEQLTDRLVNSGAAAQVTSEIPEAESLLENGEGTGNHIQNPSHN